MEVKKLDLIALQGYLDAATLALTDTRRTLATMNDAGTVTAARASAESVRVNIGHAKEVLALMQEPREWCDGCGDGSPGYQEEHADAAVSRGAVPCVVCASVNRMEASHG